MFYAVLFCAFFLLLHFTQHLNLLSETSFLNWDAAHYFFIKENGYEGFRVAFFPLFPFFWGLLHIGPAAMAFLNGLIYMGGVSLLFAVLNITDKRYFFLALSCPSLLFMFLPYSEAVFFLSAVILLIGLHKKNNLAVIAGLLLCSLARPVAYIFIPAVVLTEFLTGTDHKKILLNSLLYSFAIAFGLFITVLIQHHYTNDWFSFFKAQAGWGNYFRLPELPLNSWAGGTIVRLDGTALLIGVIASIAAVMLLIKKINKNIISDSKVLVFSILYLGGIAMFVLFFRGGWLFSLNRFVFATPFFLVASYFFLQKIHLTSKQLLICFFAVTLYWFLFKSFVHIQTLLKYEALTVYLLLFTLFHHENKAVRTISFIGCLVGNIFLLLFLYYRFLSGGWVG